MKILKTLHTVERGVEKGVKKLAENIGGLFTNVPKSEAAKSVHGDYTPTYTNSFRMKSEKELNKK